MTPHYRKLLLIIAEASLEQRLAEDVVRLGAHGYTVVDVRGAGARGLRSGDWEADRTIQMEVICEEPVAQEIAGFVQRTYFEDFAVTVVMLDVAVLRAAKF